MAVKSAQKFSLPEGTPRQKEYIECPERFKLYGGAMGGGKSFALCLHGILLSLEFPGNVGLIARYDFADLVPTTYRTFLDICTTYLGGIPGPVVKQFHQTQNWVDFTNGSRVYFRGLKDVTSLGSWNLGWFGIDEATECTEDQFNMLTSRLRLSVPGIRYFGLLASNPGLGWVHTKFIAKPMDEYAFIPALPRDNPYLPSGYESRLRRDFPEVWVRRYLDGEWLAVEGPVLPEFDPRTHVIAPINLPENWNRYRGMDYGMSAPTCVLWAAMSPSGDVFIYREYYEPNLTIAQHADNIMAYTAGERVQYTVGDPHMQSKTLEKNGGFYSPQTEFAQHGIVVVPSSSDTLASIARLRGMLRVDYSRLNYDTLSRGAPSLYIFDTVENLPDQLATWQWKTRDDGKEVTKADKQDHARDALRYLVMMLPRVGSDFNSATTSRDLITGRHNGSTD